MKKIILSLILGLLMQACQMIMPTKIESLKIVISPSISEENFLKYKKDFSVSLKTELLKNGYEVSDVSILRGASNTQTTEMILTKVADIGFLSKLSYFENREQNLEVLLSQTKETYSLAIDDLSAWNDKDQLESSKVLSDHDYAGIFLGASDKAQALYQKTLQNEKLTWIDLNGVKWCHIVVSSLEGYIYPSLWLIDNYSRRIGELFNHELVVKGYPELMQKLARKECDIALGPINIRESYASLWQTSESEKGFGQSNTIYQDVKLLALTSSIPHDPIVYSNLNTSLDKSFLDAIKKSLIKVSEAEIKNPLFEIMGLEGLVESNNEAYDSFLPAYNYLERIFN